MAIEDELTGKPEDDVEPAAEETEAAGQASEAPAADGADSATETLQKIPLAALREERTKRQTLQARLDETIGKMGKMEEMFGKFQAEAKPKEPPVPTYEEDAGGHLLGRMTSMQERLDKFESRAEQTDQERDQAGQQQQLLNQYEAAVSAFSSRQLDFQEAYTFLGHSIDADLQARGYDDPTERRQIVLFEEGQIVGRMLKQGRDPAEQIYNYAKARGYQPRAVSDEDKLARLQKGQKASTSLAGPGGRTEVPVTLERLAELADSDPKEFDKQWEKARRSGLLG